MARPLRIEFSGAIYQVTSRGNARKDIGLDDTDRAIFLSGLAEVIRRFEWRCYAYCLMGNHYHLLIETPEPIGSQFRDIHLSENLACRRCDNCLIASSLIDTLARFSRNIEIDPGGISVL
jgi:REP element-mobilizing transposase RayT